MRSRDSPYSQTVFELSVKKRFEIFIDLDNKMDYYKFIDSDNILVSLKLSYKSNQIGGICNEEIFENHRNQFGSTFCNWSYWINGGR